MNPTTATAPVTQPRRVERLMRDAKITQIWEGTNQIHRQLIGRSLDRKSVV